MTSFTAQFAAFLQPIGLTAILVYLYGYFSRSRTSIAVTEFIMGVVFGTAAIAAMASPINVAPGVIIDLRNLFVGIAAAFFGWRGGSIALSITVLVRINIGGDGAIVGVAAAVISAAMGLLWNHHISPRLSNIYSESRGSRI